jgi:hypothetical protein
MKIKAQNTRRLSAIACPVAFRSRVAKIHNPPDSRDTGCCETVSSLK